MKRWLILAFSTTMAFAFLSTGANDAEASARCRSLARRVRTYKRIRVRYIRSWRRCKRVRGSYSPRCRRLRRTANRWYRKVRRARRNYSRWGCRFGWSKWNNPWR